MTKKFSQKRHDDRVRRALLKRECTAVVSLSAGVQYMINYKKAVKAPASSKVMDALIDTTHKWYIFIAAFCKTPDGGQYMKSVDLRTSEFYLTRTLAGLLDEQWTALLDSCNQQHLIGSAWIAIPNEDADLTEAHAGLIFEKLGVWE